MNTSIVILNYRDADRTIALAREISEYRSLDHIVLVDNKSEDGSYGKMKELEKLCPDKISVIEADLNGGYAKGNNLGLLYALTHFDSDILFVANPDVHFSEDTCIRMAETLREHSEYGICAPLVNTGCNVWELPGFPGILESLFLVAFTLHKKRVRRQIQKSSQSPVKVGVVEGSFLAMRADALEKARFYDERTFLYSEEIILARRMKKAGYSECVLPFMRYDHLHSASIKKAHKSSKAKAFHHFHQSFGIYNKYYLHTNALQNKIFDICWNIGYFERMVYDMVMRFR